ncbi:MAG TPA: hypothetical protein VEV38_14735, partial [Candidatus Eremiobacteraceae bacterium]|nr:hypothetical protein [Candidatus Eremiobacteraceae bacterium]
MRRSAVALVFAVAMCASAPSWVLAATVTSVHVQYPAEGQEIGAFPKSFAIGSSPPGSIVTVNGVRAVSAPDGGWSAYVPLHPGRFIFHVRASKGAWSSETDRTVVVDDGTIAAFPPQTTIVQPGESIELGVSAPDGATVTADGPGFTSVALSPDSSAGTRAFVASVRVAGQASGPARVVYHVVTASGRTDIMSRGTLAISARPILYVGDVIPEFTGKDAGYRPYGMLSTSVETDTDLMLPFRTQLAVTGRFGDMVRVALPGWTSHVLERASLKTEPGVASLPTAVITGVEQSNDVHSTTYVAHVLGARPAFRVIEGANAAGRIDFYGAGIREGDITNDLQPAVLRFQLPQHAFWGYTTRWSGDDLVLTFKKPPHFEAPPHSAVAGLRVVIDPGHSPDTGAIGDIGTQERDINLDV